MLTYVDSLYYMYRQIHITYDYIHMIEYKEISTYAIDEWMIGWKVFPGRECMFLRIYFRYPDKRVKRRPTLISIH